MLSKPLPAQQEFFAEMGDTQQFAMLFEYQLDVYFFVKDRHSRMVYASQAFMDRVGVSRPEDFVGKTDYDFFPRHAADHFVSDDQEIMRTGQPMIGRVELWLNDQRVLDWFVTNKLPVRNTRGETIGVMGTVHSYEGRRRAMLPLAEVESTVNYIRSHLHERLTVVGLAEMSELSPRQLHRKFSSVFGLSVQDFLLKTRIQAATHELTTSTKAISQIAIDLGFCDQSAFTQQFRKHKGLTPLKFRKRYAGVHAWRPPAEGKPAAASESEQEL